MKCAIYISDDFSEKKKKSYMGSGKTWYDYGRRMLYSYASRINVPIINVTFEHELFKKYFELYKEIVPLELRHKIHTHPFPVKHYMLKMMREYVFLESDYDYAFFCDLDYILTNPEINIKDLVEEDCLYFNAYNHVGDNRLVDLKNMIITDLGRQIWARTQNVWCAGFENRYKVMQHLGLEKQYVDLIAPTTGFHCYGKPTGHQLMEFYNEHQINPMTEDGLRNISDIGFPFNFDEEFLTWAINLGDFKFRYANSVGLVDERYFHNEEPCVFWHGQQFFDHGSPPKNSNLGWMYR